MAVTQFSFDVRITIPPHSKILPKFYEELKTGKLMGTKCKGCGKLWFPPRADCKDCWSSDMEWVEVKPEGTIVTYTVTVVAPKYYAQRAPYIMAIGQLDDGPKVMAWLMGVKPEDAKPGMRVKVVIENFEDGVIRYVFRPI